MSEPVSEETPVPSDDGLVELASLDLEAIAAASPKDRRKSKDPDNFKPSDFEAHDWALETLLNFTVNLGVDNSIGLSVVSGGILISGLAIHREKWLEILVSQIKGAGADGSTEILAVALEKVVGHSFAGINAMSERREKQSLPMPATHFLHLRDARVHSPVPSDYAILRVTVDEVTAWGLGSHNPLQQKNE
jgi:hypothetical protein